jgi:protein phosphatase
MPAHSVTPSLGGLVLHPVDGPRAEEIDVFGITHTGKVRPVNQDHFLICSLHKTVQVHATSLPDPSTLPLEGERMAFLAVVADGVGGLADGEEAARAAVTEVSDYIASSLRCYYGQNPEQEATFLASLQEGVLIAHRRVQADSDQRGGKSATTLTLLLAVWPRLFVVQVGDTRCYLLRGDKLYRLTRDQTLAQKMVEAGIVTKEQAAVSRMAHVLTSAVGGSDITPVTTAITSQWGDVMLLCSDGLTKHVNEDAIRDRLRGMTSAEQACRALVDDALAAGGSDNITVLVGRAQRGATAS